MKKSALEYRMEAEKRQKRREAAYKAWDTIRNSSYRRTMTVGKRDGKRIRAKAIDGTVYRVSPAMVLVPVPGGRNEWEIYRKA